MSKSLKIILFSVTGVIGLLLLISIVLLYVVDAGLYKPRLERAASDALGMEVRIGGRLEIALFPELQIRLDDVQLRNREQEIASTKEAHIEIALGPLFHREVRILRIRLAHTRISIQRDRNGKFNFERPERVPARIPALNLDRLSFSDGTFLYGDEKSRDRYEMENFNLDVRDLRISGGNGSELFKNLSFLAEFSCREIRTKSLSLSDVKLTCKGRDGAFALDPVSLRLFGGQGSGRIDADLSASLPRYSIQASLSGLRIEEYLKTVSPKRIMDGAVNFTASLSMRGKATQELMRSASGVLSLHGQELRLHGFDLDRELSRFESSQNFSLVDVGAFFIAGPIGLAVTKGYDFAAIFQGSGGSSAIGRLSSDWKVERGKALARDVAMTTRRYRIALKGGIDFIDERFDGVTIALIDARGCAALQQKIHGPFRKPVVEKPNALISLAGPVLNLLRQAEELFTEEKCAAFYAGSVPAPR